MRTCPVVPLLAALLAAAVARAVPPEELEACRAAEEEFFRERYDRLSEPDDAALARLAEFRARCSAAVHERSLPPPERLEHLLLLDRLDRLLAWGALTEGGRRRPEPVESLEHHWRTEFGVDRTPDQVLEEALAAYRATAREMERLARAVDPALDRRAYDRRIKADHPASGEMLEVARQALEHARDYTLAADFVTVPEYARDVRVRLGDPRANTPFGHYWPTDAPGKRPGFYVVVPPGDGRDASELAELLRGNNRAWTEVVAVHEAIPGHHLQLAIAARLATRLRRTAYNSAFVEGWGLYTEHLMERHGYFDTPEERFAQLKMRLWRAARVVVDLGVHGARMPREGLERLLIEGVGHEPICARSELDRVRDTPHYYSGYFVGWTEIEALRRDCERAWGEAFTERRFHDELLACGQVPFRVVRKVMLPE